MTLTNSGALRDHISNTFDMAELHALCFDLGVDFDELPGTRKSEKSQALIQLLARRERLPELLALLADKRPAVDWDSLTTQPTTDEKPPFMGLKYFDQEDADLFYGREALTAVLLSNLRQNQFLAVVGASGSGKSSLVRAGVLPALNPEQPVHIISPGAHPLKALAISLTRDAESVTAATTLMQDMQQDPNSLDLFVTRLMQSHEQDEPLLLFVDQFEELFTACHNESERQQFVASLMHAVKSESGVPLTVIITLRADFYGHCAQFDTLREALASNQVFIGPMSATEMRQAIEKPAERFDWQFESGLIDLMLRDVADEPGALPLLSHALLETWKRRQGRTLTLSGYTEAGGVSGAIAKTADSFFGSLTPEQQQLTRSIFLRLVEPGENTADTRRRADINELVASSSVRDKVEFLLKQLADARLVTTGEGTAELAHESLIKEWPRLNLWLDDSRDNLRIHRHLTDSALEWQAIGRDSGELYRGIRLEQASEWAAATNPALNDLEREFLATSQAELARYQANRRRRRLIAGAALLVTFAALFLAVIIFSNQSRVNREQAEQLGTSEAETQRQAVALSTAEQEALLSAQDAQTKAAEAVQAEATTAFSLDELSTAQARERATATTEAVQAATAQAQLAVQATAQSDVDGDDLTFAEERQRGTDPNKVDSDGDGWNDFYDPQPLQPLISPETAVQLRTVQTIANAHTGPVSVAALSSNGNWLASGGTAGEQAKLWQTADGSLQTVNDAPQGIIHTIAFDASDDAVIVGSEDGGAVFWYPFDDAIAPLTVRGVNTLYSLAVSPDAQILSFGGTGTTRIYGFNGASFEQVGRQDNSDNPNDRVTLAAFAGDGEYFAMAEDHGRFNTVNIWQVKPFAVEFFYKFNKSVDELASMALNPNGSQIAFGHVDGTVRVYELDENGRYSLLYELASAHQGAVNTIQYSPDNSLLISGGQDGNVVFWQVADGTSVFSLSAHETGVQALTISEDGHVFATGGEDGSLIVWAVPAVESFD